MDYDDTELKRIARKISKAKSNLILEHPFFGSIALNMPMSLSEEVPTAATNGKRVLYNPKFVDNLTDEECVFLVAHEICHPMFEHNYRFAQKDMATDDANAKKWNIAADIVINKPLIDDKVGKFIDGGIENNALYDQGGGTTEGIYKILPEDAGESGSGMGDGSGGTGNDLEPGTGTSEEQDQEAAEWKVKTAQAAQAAKMAGKLSANMERFVGEILNPKVDWRDVLRRFVVKMKADDRSWARPNRRLIDQGIYLPTKTGETLGALYLAVDCSGSITEEDLNQYAAEMQYIKDEMSPKHMHVVYFDHTISHHEEYGPDDELDIKPHGGGGTAFSPIFEFAEKHDIEPVACIVLTDLYCSDYGNAPEYPVLWVSTVDHKGGSYADVPFGEVTVM